MSFDYDVVIIGGAFSGAATALMLKRKSPQAHVLIIEKKAAFDRKVGESTTEVSSCYMTRILGLTHYLGHHQLPKQGLRLWFSNRPDQAFDDCVEIGTRYQSRLPGFQLDRAKLDSHLLDRAAQAGCELWRPGNVTRFDLNDGHRQKVNVVVPSTRSGRGSAALKNGIATNGANDFPITRTIVVPRANGPRIIFSVAAGGSGSFRCKAAMSAPGSFTIAAFSNFLTDRLWDNDCTRIF